ncbi:MAG: hypothetical protein NVS2B9_05660 [Myxococcales bacterium]
MSEAPANARFSGLLLEGLEHYRKGKMLEAVRAWEAAYQLEPTNLRAREFLQSALQRIHAHMPSDPTLAAAAQALAGPAAATRAALRQAGLGQAATGQPAPGPIALGQATPGAAPARKPAAGGPHPWLPATRAGGKKPPKPGSPWDEGPSMALPQGPEQPDDHSAGAWEIHAEAQPTAPPSEDEEIEILLRGARELLALNDFSGARDLTAKILERRKGDPEAEAMHRVCEENLTQMYESSLGALTRKPRVSLKPDEIIWLNLDPRAGFVLAQIDGEVSFEDLYAICGLSQLDTAHILSQLLAEGVVSIQDDLPGPERAPAR